MESSLFWGDQYSWLLWETLAHEITCHDRIHKLLFIIYQNIPLIPYQWNNVLKNQEKFGNPRTLTSTNKNDSAVIVWPMWASTLLYKCPLLPLIWRWNLLEWIVVTHIKNIGLIKIVNFPLQEDKINFCVNPSLWMFLLCLNLKWWTKTQSWI